MSRRIVLLSIVVFVVLLVAWKWSLLDALLRPSLVDVGLVEVVETPLVVPGLAYPALGIEAPVTESSETSPLSNSDWSTIAVALRSGVSLAYDGETFSEQPLAFVTGHSSDVIQHPYASIFASLGQAQLQDTFLLSLSTGSYVYTVVDKQIVQPTNIESFRALAPAPDQPQRVALVTCWPPLTTRDRMVVVGELTSTDTKTLSEEL